MWHTVSELLLLFFSTVFCAAAVKLVDDYLDKELDAIDNQPNWIVRLGDGTVVYAMPLMVISISLRSDTSAALFLSAWAIGMFQHLGIKYPSGLHGWQEAVLSIGFGCLLAGWRVMLLALLITLGVQLVDDMLDRRSDCHRGLRNLADRWGMTECFLLVCICFFSAWWIAKGVIWPILGGIAVIYLLSLRA